MPCVCGTADRNGCFATSMRHSPSRADRGTSRSSRARAGDHRKGSLSRGSSYRSHP
jgi:hypothetical protein